MIKPLAWLSEEAKQYFLDGDNDTKALDSLWGLQTLCQSLSS